jgi:hypothetical protein
MASLLDIRCSGNIGKFPWLWQGQHLPEVKKEMKGRYPKHPWPDNPWNAEATARPSRGSDEAQGCSLKKNVCTIDMPPSPAA